MEGQEMGTCAKLMLGGLLVALLVTVGCGVSSEDKTIEQLTADVAKLDSAALKTMAEDFETKIAAKTTEVADLQKQVTEAAADKVEALKVQLADAKTKLADLNSRLLVVTTEITKKAAAAVVAPVTTD